MLPLTPRSGRGRVRRAERRDGRRGQGRGRADARRRAEGSASDELIAYGRARLAHYKVPQSVDFVDALPRLPTGKLYKQALRAQYLV